MSERAEITLEIADQEFTFKLTPQDVTKYFNAVTANNKVAPSHNLLVNTVAQEQLASLKAHLVNPVITMKIAGTLLEEYAPDVEVTVKKRSATLNA
ncbi:putative phage tail assembly chaperone [Pseudomonas sp. SCB32]|uniref:putative phage tail assembly chaperone n=1 Tax=Pseudomonas sp. SCB32 TaxID=2653853 RepID=UPI001265887C|nr:putative phage tail assembly chaperone [Pseudomonas sp. SCB32]